ncbi:endolytic transglycosylase MltG [Mangrovicella endophytica]|uniref:endolytic transglycosylase MltG n=1 Tax=Mangrovicella endophytica TaxID=2066697 RepID=UPI001FDFC370|nr:endolytic transglycosylase MltG [Mangrovicella endophytica]
MTDDETGHGGRIVPRSASEALRPSPGPVPPRRSRHARNRLVVFLNFMLSIAVLAVIGGAAVAYWGKLEFEGPGPLKQEATYLVQPKSGVGGIAAGLEREGIISDATIFEYGVRLSGVGGELKAGEYGFQPGASMRDVMDRIRSGQSILHAVTIPEGWTVKQIYARVANEPALAGDMPPEAPEGTLRPDTYKFTRGRTRTQMIDEMRQAQDKLVKQLWADRDPSVPVKDIGQFVTLASIVEKETGIAAERPRVASVFINRLNKGMRLQSDPTIIYGVWGGAGKPSDEPIRQSHIKDDNPYNTYVIKGLPPGPIANPGKAALEAVARPLKTDDIYFVADGTGGHVFADTLDKHNENVRRYRELERQQKADAAATVAQ